MARKIIITSGKGGVGKTTIVSCLGMTIAKMGYKTMLIDMDFGLNNLDVLTGIENKIVYDIIDVLEMRCSPKQALVQDFYESNLYIFPSSHGFCRVKFGSRELIKIINELENMFDFILIDCPAGIDGGFKRAVECANEFVIITTPHLSAVRDASKVLSLINSNMDVAPMLIINRARGDLIVDKEMLSEKSINDYLRSDLIGVIPEDDEICKQLLYGGVLANTSDAQKSLNLIANNLVMGERKIYDCTKKYKGILGGIRKNIKRIV